MNEYQDIINLKRPFSKRIPMSMDVRTAQFAPFSALTGYNEAIKEVERITTPKRELSEGLKEIINEKLNIIAKNEFKGLVKISYFSPDSKKSGGEYKNISQVIKKIDVNNGVVILLDNQKIPLDNISDIDCDLFNIYEL